MSALPGVAQARHVRRPSPEELDWQLQALCREVSPELFFPNYGERKTDALRICHSCPVEDECLAYALKYREPHGIWGGATEEDRRRMRPVWKSA